MDLVGLQKDGFVDSLHELSYRCVDATLNAGVLSDFVLNLFDEVSVKK